MKTRRTNQIILSVGIVLLLSLVASMIQEVTAPYAENETITFVEISSFAPHERQRIPLPSQIDLNYRMPSAVEVAFIGDLNELLAWNGVEVEMSEVFYDDKGIQRQNLFFPCGTEIQRFRVAEGDYSYFYNSYFVSVVANYLVVLDLFNEQGLLQNRIVRVSGYIHENYTIYRILSLEIEQ